MRAGYVNITTFVRVRTRLLCSGAGLKR